MQKRIVVEQENHTQERQTLEGQVYTLSQDSRQLSLDLSALQARLQNMRDYDEVKHELEVIKVRVSTISHHQRIEFHGADASSPNSSPLSVEQLLVNKNKRLEGEITSIKVRTCACGSPFKLLNQEKLEETKKLQSALATATAQVSEQNALILRLESDLSKLNEATTNNSKNV